jgi:predicted MPP superfamily phosphohydrolase
VRFSRVAVARRTWPRDRNGRAHRIISRTKSSEAAGTRLAKGQTMPLRFWISVALFHGVVGPAAAWVIRRSIRSADWPARAWVSGTIVSALRLALAVGVAVIAATAIGYSSAFTVLRLLAQFVFGELFLVVAIVGIVCLRRRRPVRGAAITAVALIIGGAYVEAYHREPHDLQVRNHEVRLGRMSGRPLRIAHLSDIQTAEVGPYEERALREAMALAPDLIVLTGDYVQGWNEDAPPELERAFRDLVRRARLQAPLGVFAVKGDVEGPGWTDLFAGTGVTCLQGRSALVTRPEDGRTLAIVGLDSSVSHGSSPQAIRNTIAAGPPADLRLVIGHAPDFVAHVVPGTVDLALAGHTHGGQVVLPLLGPPIVLSRLPRRYAADVNDYAGTPIHVTRGVGMERGTAPQFRFLCRPEICLLTLVSGRPASQ